MEHSNSSAIVVNVKHSCKERPSLEEAAASAWWYRGEKQYNQLRTASFIIAAENNQVRGVFENLETSIISESSDRVQFALAPCATLAPLTGHFLPESVRWKQGDAAAWKFLAGEDFQTFIEQAKGYVQEFGPYLLKLTREANLQVVVPAGYNVEIISDAKQVPVKQRIEDALNALATTNLVTTYGTLAEALGVNSSQAVARSIVRNANISKEVAARVFNMSYIDSQGALVPDDDMSTLGNETKTRPELLVESGVGVIEGDRAKIPLDSILLDPIVLRLTLNI